ncbi:substrate-binding periplasmic protein [Bdellovibrio sp. HCB209]|uniref:substrate-binding periplasmic protein n=1 Tax=Bdellovibrio sp. HCB209 TaxID=3394354 RepID=UPI0039B5E7BE
MLAWLLILFSLTPSHAQFKFRDPASTPAACEKRYVIAVMNSPPSYFVEKGKKTGVGYDILTEVVRRLQCKYTDMISSNSSLIASFGRRSVDLFGPLLSSAQLAQGEFILTWKLPRYLVVRKDASGSSLPDVKSVVSDSKMIFGNLISGKFFLNEQELTKLFAEKRLKEYPLPEDLMIALKENKIQALFAGPFVLYHYITRSGQADQYHIIEDKTSPLVETGFFMSTTRLSAQERKRIRQVFKEMQEDGTLLKIVKKYLAPESYRHFAGEDLVTRLSSHRYRDLNNSKYFSFDYHEF